MDKSIVERIVEIWKLAAPPIRPSMNAMSIYCSHLPDGTGWSGFVQGATPEVADMMISHGASRVVSMDLSREVIEAMRILASEDWSGVETIIDDWCNYRPDFERSFDIIISDGGGLFLPFPDGWRRLYEVIFRYLAKGGTTMLRVYTVSDSAPAFREYYEQAVERFERESASRSSEEQAAMFVSLASELKCAAYFRAVDSQGMIILDRIAESVSFMKDDLKRRYPGGTMSRVVDAICSRFKSVEHQGAMIVAAPRYNLIQPLLESIGFKVTMERVDEPPEGGVTFVVIATCTE
jgi:SAM-dependent methyltransferase